VADTGFSGYTGDNVPASAARLSNPQDVGIDTSGNIFIADGGNHRVRIVMGWLGILGIEDLPHQLR
jgi:NHL repeat